MLGRWPVLAAAAVACCVEAKVGALCACSRATVRQVSDGHRANALLHRRHLRSRYRSWRASDPTFRCVALAAARAGNAATHLAAAAAMRGSSPRPLQSPSAIPGTRRGVMCLLARLRRGIQSLHHLLLDTLWRCPAHGSSNLPDSPACFPSQWNCQTGAGKFKRPGHCGKVNRSMASFELINEFDIGIVTDFLPTDSARAILDKMKTLPASQWVQIDNRAARSMGNSKRAFKPQVDMDYKMYDLNTESHREMRSWVEPLFAPYFQGKGQQLSLFLGKYQHGSYVTAHTDGAVVTLNGDDRFQRKRAFLLYLNDGWTEDDGGLC